MKTKRKNVNKSKQQRAASVYHERCTSPIRTEDEAYDAVGGWYGKKKQPDKLEPTGVRTFKP